MRAREVAYLGMIPFIVSGGLFILIVNKGITPEVTAILGFIAILWIIGLSLFLAAGFIAIRG